METDEALAAEIVFGRLGQAPIQVTPIVGKGSVNKVFIVSSSAGMTVVRLCKLEDSQQALPIYEKEAWCLGEAARLGIPGPAVLAVGSWGERPYMLQSLVPGNNGEEQAADSLATWRALGRYARLIHSVRLTGFGGGLAGFYSGQAQAKWEKFVNYNLGELTSADELIKLKVYHPEQADQIRAWFYALRETPYSFGLNHGDLSLRNTLVDQAGQVSLLDWGSAEAHIVPHYDFVHLLRENDPAEIGIKAFLEGYGMAAAEFAQLLPELRSLMLLKDFDLTRWAIDRCPERIQELAERARTTLQIRIGC